MEEQIYEHSAFFGNRVLMHSQDLTRNLQQRRLGNEDIYFRIGMNHEKPAAP